MLTAYTLQAGVITGDNVRKVFEYARENKVRLLMLSLDLKLNKHSVRHPRKLELLPPFALL